MKQKQAGFTLIELLIVIILLGILATLGVPAFISTQKKSRDAKRKGDLQMISKALEMYYNDNGVYPPSTDGQIAPGGTAVNWGNAFIHPTNANVIYMQKLPKDPKGGYTYFYQNTGSGYYLFARLENTDDGDAAKNSSGAKANYGSSYTCVNIIALPGSVANCNYVIPSANLAPPATTDE